MKLSVNCALTDKTRLFKALERRFNAVLLAHWAFLRFSAAEVLGEIVMLCRLLLKNRRFTQNPQ